MKKKIVIVEDDKKLNQGIKLALRNADYEFIQCYSIEEAKKTLAGNTVDLILLDVNLPDGNGMDYLKDMRRSLTTPVIIITANNMETDIIMGLEYGANDYITKPFSLMILRARVEVQLRDHSQSVPKVYESKDFQFDFERMLFYVHGNPVEFSKTEQRLLRMLTENKGSTIKRSALIDYVWSGDSEYVDEHALTVAIKRLRDKLEEDASHPAHLKTVYGIGYTWSVVED